MRPALLADLVLLAHLAFIAFAVLGGLLALRFAWAPLVHLPALGWAAWVELTGGLCPLTPLENSLRRAAGESGYATSFVEQYLDWISWRARFFTEVLRELKERLECSLGVILGIEHLVEDPTIRDVAKVALEELERDEGAPQQA